MRVHSLVAWKPRNAGAAPVPSEAFAEWERWTRGALTVAWRARTAAPVAPVTSLPALILGDAAEWDSTTPGASMAGGAVVRFDERADALLAQTSIVGLPPIFVYDGPHVLAIASDLHALTLVPGVHLELDAEGVTELGRFGHPVGGRTLFRDVRLIAGGGCLRIGAEGEPSFAQTWKLPAPTPLPAEEFVEAQIAAFRAAIARTDLSGTFLSLTAGLDTRTVFSMLAEGHRAVPAVTMTGARRSLDARIAGRLCRAYGIRHELVTFDERFAHELPRLVGIASRLSGGISSMGQAPEIYLYEQAGGGFVARLSGNLGNQVGRGGTEGVSLRNAQLDILSPRLRGQQGAEHWLLGKLGGDEDSRLEFILSAEIAWSSVANYSVGNHFAAQQTPYADRTLIETLACRPRRGGSAPSGSLIKMRLRDLHHRFRGEPKSASFQRTLVDRIGGAASQIPINWGWRPSGGVSLPGLAMGVATLAGMAARAKGLDAGLLRRPLAWSGLPALHDFHESRRWLRDDLRPFVRDTLASARVREAGLFDIAALTKLLDEHFSGSRDHYKSVTFALDVAMAQANFCESPSSGR